MAPMLVTVRDSAGTFLAVVTVSGGRVRVEPPTATGHPLVAGVVSELERSGARARSRPSC